jgi:hypothetical protein
LTVAVKLTLAGGVTEVGEAVRVVVVGAASSLTLAVPELDL